MDFIVPNVYHSPAAKDKYAIISTSACKLLAFIAHNTSASTVYVQVHDKVTQPTLGDVPIAYVKINSQEQGGMEADVIRCIPLSTGLVIAASTTGPTYTDTTTNDLFITVFTV